MNPLPIQTIINDVLVKKNEERKKEYTQTSWHCSSLGNCMRGNYLDRLGIDSDEPITPETLRKFSAGNIFEEWVVTLLKENSEGSQVETQVRVVSEVYNLSGRLDVLLTDKSGEKTIYEIKSQHSKSFWWNIHNSNKPQRHHEYQIWCYLKILGIEKGIITYLSKDDLSVQEYEVKLQNTELAKEVIEYLELLNKAWKEKNPLLLPMPEPRSWKAKYCKHHKKCVDEIWLQSLSTNTTK